MFYQSMIHNSIFRYSVHKTARIVSEYVPEVYQYRFSHDGPYSSIPQPSDPPGTLSNQHRRNKHFYAEFGEIMKLKLDKKVRLDEFARRQLL